MFATVLVFIKLSLFLIRRCCHKLCTTYCSSVYFFLHQPHTSSSRIGPAPKLVNNLSDIIIIMTNNIEILFTHMSLLCSMHNHIQYHMFTSFFYFMFLLRLKHCAGVWYEVFNLFTVLLMLRLVTFIFGSSGRSERFHPP